MNFETGVKEAKLVDPTEELSSDIVIIDQNDGVISEEYTTPPIASPPALHSDESPIKPPKEAGAGDGMLFSSSVEILSTPTSPESSLASALGNLEELAHEMYWGAELASPAALHALLSLISASPSPQIRASAALVLGSALSNNNKALSKALNNGPSYLVNPLIKALETETDASARKRVLFALAQVAKDDLCAEAFLNSQGIETLKHVVVKAQDIEFSGKAAVLLEDTFLNADMGAIQRPEVVSQFCAPFEDVLVEAEGHDDAREKVLGVLAKGRCAVDGKFLVWLKEQLGAAGSRSVEQLVDDGETFLAAVVERAEVLIQGEGRGEL